MTNLLLDFLLPLSLAVIMLGMGMALTLDDFKRVFKQPKAVFAGLINQVILLPLLAFFLAIVFKLDTEMAMGLIIIASCPGGTTSNIIAQICNGNVALSVTLTAVSSCICIFSTHFIASFALDYFNTCKGVVIELSALDTMFQVMVITIIPISIGIIIKNYKPAFATAMINPLKTASTFIFIGIFIGIIATNSDSILSALKRVGLVTLILNVGIITSGFLLAKIFKLGFKDAIAIGVDGGIQNATMGFVIATTLLQKIEMAIPTAAYTIWMYSTGLLLMWFISNRNKVKA